MGASDSRHSQGREVDSATVAPGNRSDSSQRQAWVSLCLRWLLALIWFLSLCDLLLTRSAMNQGRAAEANAVMNYAFNAGSVPAFVFKMGVTTVGVLLLWLLRRHRLAFVAASLLTALLAAVVTYEALWRWVV